VNERIPVVLCVASDDLRDAEAVDLDQVDVVERALLDGEVAQVDAVRAVDAHRVELVAIGLDQDVLGVLAETLDLQVAQLDAPGQHRRAGVRLGACVADHGDQVLRGRALDRVVAVGSLR